jgi:hypothetical protein
MGLGIADLGMMIVSKRTLFGVWFCLFLLAHPHAFGREHSLDSPEAAQELALKQGSKTRPPSELSIIAEGPVLVTPVLPDQRAASGNWLRLDLTGDVGAVLARHVQSNFEISCVREVGVEKVSMCTIWFHRSGDGRSTPPPVGTKWKVSDTVIGFSRLGRVSEQWDRLWVEVESPFLSEWFSVDEGRDIRCVENRCAFSVMRIGSLDPWTPGDRRAFR